MLVQNNTKRLNNPVNNNAHSFILRPYINGWQHLKEGYRNSDKQNLLQRIVTVLVGVALWIPIINMIIDVSIRVFFSNHKEAYLKRVDALVRDAGDRAQHIENEEIRRDIFGYISDLHANIYQFIEDQENTELYSEILEMANTEFRCVACQIQELSKVDKEYYQPQREPTNSHDLEWQKRIINVIRRSKIEEFRALVEETLDQGVLNRKMQGGFFGGNVFHHLAKLGDPYIEYVSILIQLKIDPAIIDNWGNTALHWALANAHNGMARFIIEQCGSDFYIDHQSALEGNTPLHLAVGKGYKNRSKDGQRLKYTNLEIIHALIAQKCDVNLQNKMGNTALHLACLRRDVDMIRALLKAGADPTIRNQKGKIPQDLLSMDYETSSKILNETVFAFLLDKAEHAANLKEANEIFDSL